MIEQMELQISSLIKQNIELRKENISLKRENAELKLKLKSTCNKLAMANNRIKQLESVINTMEKNQEELIEKIVTNAVNKATEKLNKEHKKEIDKLNAKIKVLEKKLNTDSTNSGTPSSKNRIGKHIIQNNRESSEKHIGGQKGHPIHKLEYFKPEEITKIVEHKMNKCPKCGKKLVEKNSVISDIIDIEVKITKIRNKIYNYKCNCCKKILSANKKLPRGVSYGENVNALALAMACESNTPLNKIASLINGISDNKIKISEGYLIKLIKKSSSNLKEFIKKLKEKITSLNHVFWDDTTIKYGIDDNSDGDTKTKIKNGIIRFYGDDKWAYFIGHKNKNATGIDEDGILECLSDNCVVMHDHTLINYNNKYNFKNAECNQHILRYLKANLFYFPDHKWAIEMRKLLSDVNKERNNLIMHGIDCFSLNKINNIQTNFDEIINLAYEENKHVNATFIQSKMDEKNLIDRLIKFKENHLLFIHDFNVAFTNNTSERALRQVKRKLAVAFMFKNIDSSKNYSNLISYLETCYRNNISRFNACKRLVSNNPLTIAELEC